MVTYAIVKMLVLLMVLVVVGCSGSPNIGQDPSWSSGATGDVGEADAGTENEAGSSIIDIAKEPCDKISTTPGGEPYLFAEHVYAGMTAAELTSVFAIAHYPYAVQDVFPNGYDSQTQPVWLKDERVAVSCGKMSDPYIDHVTFVRR